MSTQRALLALAMVAGLLSGAIYYAASQRVGVVVAGQHLSPGRAIAEADLELRWLPSDAVPPGAVTETSAATDRFPLAPLSPGQLVLADGLAPAPATFESGLVPPTGHRAVAVPVTPEQALGGAIAPGARVDVISVPRPGQAPDERFAELLTEGALVLEIRGEHGGAMSREGARAPQVAARERLGSVVLAVGPTDAAIIAERVASSTFVLILVPPLP